MSDSIHIEIRHPADLNGSMDVANKYDINGSKLDMPAHIKIGAKGTDGDKIMSYAEMVSEYDCWLEEQIRKQNLAVMQELDVIYNKALGAGVIITCTNMPHPYTTHAHIVKRQIMDLLG